jgi:hypothetical protein
MPLTEDAKYMSAGRELATRIQTREFTLFSYIGFSGTLLSISLAYENVSLMCIAIPYLALAASLLNAHHDVIIGLLSRYMKELESGSSISWHTEKRFIGKALRARMIRDVAAGTFLLLSAIAALVITKPNLVNVASTSKVTGLWWGGVLCVPIILIVFLSICVLRHRMSSN